VAIGEHMVMAARPVPKTGLTLIVPQEHAPAFQCSVPVSLDDCCGATFSIHERPDFERHVAKCIRAHEDVIRAASPSIRRDVLHGIFDKDLERWMDDNRTALLEDRKRI
jgi:hypothetical protein